MKGALHMYVYSTCKHTYTELVGSYANSIGASHSRFHFPEQFMIIHVKEFVISVKESIYAI